MLKQPFAAQRKGAIVGAIAGAALLLSIVAVSAQGPVPQSPGLTLGTGFTYQGQLKNSGAPVNGACSIAFRLYDDAASGAPVGSALTQTIAITNGLFTTSLDFGVGAFNGDARWLDMQVRCPAGSGAYSALNPRQALTAAPYALALPGLRTEPNATSPNVIGGYSGNFISSTVVGSVIGGGGASGFLNLVQANYATVGGGHHNTASGTDATLGGGQNNTASGPAATVGGGNTNTASNVYATVGGGNVNNASGYAGAIGGGQFNNASNQYATVGGGQGNTASNQFATVGGGGGNNASNQYATVSGGYVNNASGYAGTIGGGASITTSGDYATVGGGLTNIASNFAATVGGGFSNAATTSYATVGGGQFNTASGGSATVGGGLVNIASGGGATVGGGSNNNADGYAATVAGGYYNTANGSYSMILGGSNNTVTGTNSMAGGNYALANGNGCFAWGDHSTTAVISCDAPNVWSIRSTGGFFFRPAINIFCSLTDVSGWQCINTSDRSAKQDFVSVNPRQVLHQVVALPIERWAYNNDAAHIQHIGPMAQDFYAAFGLGADDKHINPIDSEGVALAAIQGLYQVVQDKDTQIAALQQQNADLNARVSKLEQHPTAGNPPLQAEPFNVSTLLSVIALSTVGCMWLQQRRSKRGAP